MQESPDLSTTNAFDTANAPVPQSPETLPGAALPHPSGTGYGGSVDSKERAQGSGEHFTVQASATALAPTSLPPELPRAAVPPDFSGVEASRPFVLVDPKDHK